MTPTDVFQKLLTTNKSVANFILAGLALLAAATIAVSWIGDNPDALFIAAYVLGFAFLVTMITYIVRNDRMRAVLGWVLTGAIILFLAGLIDSALGFSGRLPTPACYVRILWEHPRSCEQRLFPVIEVSQAAAVIPAVAWRPADGGPERLWDIGGGERLWLAQDGATPRAEPYDVGPIFLQFGGDLDRETATAIAQRLTALGWPVQGGDKGGEMVKTVPTTNEVRFFDPAAMEAAIELARGIKAERPGADIVVRDFSRSGMIAPTGLLEIWLAH